MSITRLFCGVFYPISNQTLAVFILCETGDRSRLKVTIEV